MVRELAICFVHVQMDTHIGLGSNFASSKQCEKMKLRIFRALQLFWAYFIGIGALVGAAMMLYDPSGKTFSMDALLPLLREAFPFAAPLFSNFICSAIVLLMVNGVPNFVSAVLIHRRSRYGAVSGLVCGSILLAWICVEFYVWGFAGLSIAYGLFAVCQIINAILFLNQYENKTRAN